MRINSSTGQPEIRETGISTPADAAAKPAASAGAPAAGAPAPLQSDTLKPAQEALAALPEIDAAKVAEIKAALADGRISFDAGKLAGLIQRYHGGRE